MIVLWSGTEVGQDTWVEYTDSKRLNLIKKGIKKYICVFYLILNKMIIVENQ